MAKQPTRAPRKPIQKDLRKDSRKTRRKSHFLVLLHVLALFAIVAVGNLAKRTFLRGPAQVACPTTRNAVLDIGSGNTKLRVGDVDCQGRFTLVLQERERVPYMSTLNSSSDRRFSDEIIQQGVTSVQTLKEKAQALTPPPTRYTAIATAAFREAGNGTTAAEAIRAATGVPIHIIPQEEEGRLGFLAATLHSHQSPQDSVVWDLGGGSMQISYLDDAGQVRMARAAYGADTFMGEVVSQIKRQPLTADASPNPLNARQMNAAYRLAQRRAREHFRADTTLRQRIRSVSRRVIGIGGVFGVSIKNQIANTPSTAADLEDGIYTAQTIDQMFRLRIGMNDEQLRGVLDDGFHRTHATHFALTRGYMNVLGINEIRFISTETGDGVFSSIRYLGDSGTFDYGGELWNTPPQPSP